MTQAIKIIKGGMMENHQNPKRQNDTKYPKILKDGMTKKHSKFEKTELHFGEFSAVPRFCL